MVKLKRSAKKYYNCYNGNISVFQTPGSYFQREWELIGEFKDMKKIYSDGITILVYEDDIIKI